MFSAVAKISEDAAVPAIYGLTSTQQRQLHAAYIAS